jgi:hypothetical protein
MHEQLRDRAPFLAGAPQLLLNPPVLRPVRKLHHCIVVRVIRYVAALMRREARVRPCFGELVCRYRIAHLERLVHVDALAKHDEPVITV